MSLNIESLGREFLAVFAGLERAHGKYDLTRNSETSDKGKITGAARTVNEKISEETWKAHLSGKLGIGIVPIRDDGTVNFGAIDVDKYDVDLDELSKRLSNSPLILIRSKSGGAHIFLFTSERVPAIEMIKKLRDVSSFLGYGGSEIFPKQQALGGEGDCGNWINMPYFDANDTLRYAIVNGKKLSASAFLKHRESVVVDRQGLRDFTFIKSEDLDKEFGDGPPCLQILVKLGFPAGTRNNGLYNLAVLARMKFPDTWQEVIHQWNERFMQPPLKRGEVEALIKSISRKTYTYKCNDMPICPHCDKATCQTRKHGVGGSDDSDEMSRFPVVSGLVKIQTDPPMYFINVDSSRIGPLESSDLMSQPRFRKKCMEAINLIPTTLKAKRWDSVLTRLLESVQLVEAPHDSSLEGQLLENLYHFTHTSSVTENDVDILLGKPYVEGKYVFFRMRDFVSYLTRNRFEMTSTSRITAIFNKNNILTVKRRVGTRAINMWRFDYKKEEEALEVPNPKDIEF